MYPLDVQPEGLAALLRKFRRVEDVKECVCQQLVGGAQVALAFVRAWHPALNFKEIAHLPPSEGNVVDFMPHYVVVGDPAARIIAQTEAQTERLFREGVNR